MPNNSKINGLDVSLITKISGVNVGAISRILGVPTSSLIGWPGTTTTTTAATTTTTTQAPQCTLITLGFDPMMPNMACTAPPQSFDYDSSTNTLWMQGGCGTVPATKGYYSDGTRVFVIDERGTLDFFNFCRA